MAHDHLDQDPTSAEALRAIKRKIESGDDQNCKDFVDWLINDNREKLLSGGEMHVSRKHMQDYYNPNGLVMLAEWSKTLESVLKKKGYIVRLYVAGQGQDSEKVVAFKL